MAETSPELFTTEEPVATTTHTEQPHGGDAGHAEPELWGFAPYQWVSISMLVLLLIAFFGAKVHKTITGGLDGQIAAIREELDEAKRLRAEAEKLRDEYTTKIANAETDAEAMLDNAKAEAEAILRDLRNDLTTSKEAREVAQFVLAIRPQGFPVALQQAIAAEAVMLLPPFARSMLGLHRPGLAALPARATTRALGRTLRWAMRQ